jgi:uncharacterized protein (TIGR03083 family)
MTDLQAELRAEILAAHGDLVGVLDGLSPAEWERPTPNEGWSVKDTLAHLCTIEQRLRGQIDCILTGVPFPTEDIDSFNARMVAARRGRTIAQLRGELEQERATTLALLDRLSPADFEKSAEHPRRGRMDPERVFRNIPDHMHRHTEDILAGPESG